MARERTCHSGGAILYLFCGRNPHEVLVGHQVLPRETPRLRRDGYPIPRMPVLVVLRCIAYLRNTHERGGRGRESASHTSSIPEATAATSTSFRFLICAFGHCMSSSGSWNLIRSPTARSLYLFSSLDRSSLVTSRGETPAPSKQASCGSPNQCFAQMMLRRNFSS